MFGRIFRLVFMDELLVFCGVILLDVVDVLLASDPCKPFQSVSLH